MLTDFSLKRWQRRVRMLAVVLVVALPVGLWVGGALPVAVHLIPAPWDKLAHALVFAVLAFAVGLASGLSGRAAMAVAFCGALAVGALDEWHQMSLAGRAAGWDDLLADAAGAALGSALLGMRARRCNKIEPHRAQ